MKKFERVDLGNGFFLDRDPHQWSLHRAGTAKDGSGYSRDKSGQLVTSVVGYYPTLRGAMAKMADLRLGETHIDSWHDVVGEIDKALARFEGKLPAFWRGDR